MVWSHIKIFSGKEGCMYCLNMHFQNYNKIDSVCKASSLLFVMMKTKQLNRLDVKVTLCCALPLAKTGKTLWQTSRPHFHTDLM